MSIHPISHPISPCIYIYLYTHIYICILIIETSNYSNVVVEFGHSTGSTWSIPMYTRTHIYNLPTTQQQLVVAEELLFCKREAAIKGYSGNTTGEP